MKIFLLVFFVLLAGPSHAQSVSWNWGRQIGGTGADGASNTAIDAAGNTIQVGTFSNAVTIGATTLTSLGDMALYLVKYNSQGQLVWARQAGDAPAPGSGIASASGLSLTTDISGNIYVVGAFNGSVTFGSTTLNAPIGPAGGAVNSFVCKYSSAGSPIWAILAGGPIRTEGYDIAVDNISGNVVVAGSYLGSATFGNVTLVSQGDEDIFVAKYTNQGSLVWARSAGGAFPDYSNSLAIDNQSNIYLAGIIQNAATFGSITVFGYGSADAFIAKYDAQGTSQWANLYGGVGYDEAVQVTLDNNGGFYLVGDFEQSVAFAAINLTSQGAGDGFVLRGTPQGNVTWAKQFSGPGDEAFLNVRLSGNGAVYLAGAFSSTIATFDNHPFNCAGGADILLMRCDVNGNFVWGERGGGIANDIPAGLACDATGGISVGSNFLGTTQYGPFSFASRGGADAVILHLQDNTVTGYYSGISLKAMSIYPNPAVSTSLVTLDLPAVGQHESATIEIVTSTGNVVRLYNKPSLAEQVKIDLSGCSPGVYTIIYKGANNVNAIKLILQ